VIDLCSDGLTPEAAAADLEQWGFLAHADLPDGAGCSHLLVAIRKQPTDRHFDPERVRYWVAQAGRGVRAEITLDTPLPLRTAFAWGTIRIDDRFGIANEWVSCGGDLEVVNVAGTAICVFRSDAPILRRGGHSQGWDHAAANLAAFFARLTVAVTQTPDFEARIAATPPRALFAAFLSDLLARYRASPTLSDLHPDLRQLLATEAARLREREPGTWQEGEELAATGFQVRSAG
jgi:hypothetical protein